MAAQSDVSARRLTVIMFTDIVGFAKKLSDNEAYALELLKTHDALIRVLTAKFDGKVIKLLGDLSIIEFPNAVNAVKCALEIQKRFWNFNRGKTESDSIRIRAGIHMGEVIFRNDDVLGECVTITSRIEALAEPNRICISLDVYDHVKNTIPLRVFKIGKMELKDISKQVEVYEVLNDSIPELSQPSSSAQKALSSQQTTSVVMCEAEELKEAKKIEEIKKRLISDLTKSDEVRKSKIAAHYAKAENYFKSGELEKAEQEIAEIAKLDSRQNSTTERQRKAEEDERAVQNHLNKARELITLEKFDDAEAEVNEIFRLFPLHIGAQQLLMQLEEERYRQEEKKREKQTENIVKHISDEERKIEELLAQSRTLLQEEKFSEATLKLRELFLIDPNHSGARRMQESIRQAEQAKAELLRIQAEHAQEERRLQELAMLKRKVEEQRKRKLSVPQKVNRETRYTKLNYIAMAIITLSAVFFGIPKLMDWIFPKTASLAIMQFTHTSHNAGDLNLSEALPVLLAEDFSRCDNLTVIAPSSSFFYTPDPANLRKIASMLQVEYLLIGIVKESKGRYSISLSLHIPEQEKTLFLGDIEGTLSTLHEMRTSILQKVLANMEINSIIPAITQPSNINAYEKYLKGVCLAQLKLGMQVDSAKTLLLSALEIDTSLGFAYGKLAELELRAFQKTNDRKSLQSAVEYAQHALRCSPGIAPARRILATYYRLSQNYNAALSSITLSLTSLPQNPDCYRELALLSLIAGKYEDAYLYASNVILHDPKNVESHFTLALVQHMKRDYSAAETSYQQAAILGENDSLLTANFVQNLWIGKERYDKAARYCQQMLRKSPNDYRYYYRLGRCNQLSLQISSAQQWLEDGLALTQRIIETNPGDAIAHAYAGLFFTRLGKFSDGETEMNKAMQLDSSSIDVLFRSASLYSIQRNKQKALLALDKALQLQYNFAELLNPDLSFISNEPEFLPTITRKIEGKWQMK